MSNRAARQDDGPASETERAGLRRSLRALAGFIELGRRILPSDPEEQLYRQALLAAMGATGAISGVVLRIEAGDAAMLEAFGPWGEPVSRTVLSFGAKLRRSLEGHRVVRLLDANATSVWQAFTAPGLPTFVPRLIVLLRNGQDETLGLVLLGERQGVGDYDEVDAEPLHALAGLFTLLADRLAFAPQRRRRRSVTTSKDDQRNGIHPALRRFLGRSSAAQQIRSDLAGVAATNCPLLLEGESGTGKELLAGIAHEISCGGGAPFEAISCGAIPETLIESELFGHVRGAFTGATRDHRGVFERGRGGTVFLDEIGEMPLSAQVKLLRVLQEGSFIPVGGEQLRPINSRVIAATNRVLQAEVEANRFRQDLFYRLNVFPIRLPLLRDRVDDIPLLIEHFVARHATEAGERAPVVRAPAMRRLRIYSYPGNVRELQNIVRAMLLEARGAAEITDRHVVAVFSRHRLGGLGGAAAEPVRAPSDPAIRKEAEEVGCWVVAELRRYYFNLALAERMLERRRRSVADRRAVPVYSRSGLTYYLQGECFRSLAESRWDPEVAAKRLADGTESLRRVRGKLEGLLDSALEVLRGGGRTPDSRLDALHSRFPKLPGCYEPHLNRLAAEYERGRWH